MNDVSIIIVNWNTRDILRQCLNSIYTETSGITFEVIVIDNASSDESVSMVKKEFPQVVLIQNSLNRGFAAANNQGIMASKARYVLLLNPDTIILDNAIAKVVAFAEANRQAGAIGCRVLNPDRTLQQTCFMYPSLLNMFLSSTYLYKLFPKNHFFGRERMTWWGRNDERDVDVVTGCFMLVRREAIEQVGFLDEQFFMYGEETDWCYRFRQAGWRIRFWPGAQIIHLGGQSSKKVKSEMLVALRLSILQFMKKHCGWLAHKTACVLTVIFFLLRIPVWFGVRVFAPGNRKAASLRLAAYCRGIVQTLSASLSLSAKRSITVNLKVIAAGAKHMLVKRYMGPFWLRRRWLYKTQWLNREELTQVQVKLLQRIVRHSYDTVPYYRKVMIERGIDPTQIRTLDDIRRFPVLSKKDVLEAGESMVSKKYPHWLLRRALTGGTTGTPLLIWRDPFSMGSEHAFVRRQWDWAGIGLADRCAWIIAGRRIADPNQTDASAYAYDPFMKELTLSIYHLSRQTAPLYVEMMNCYRVKAIVGVCSAIHFLARMCLDEGITVKLKAALTTSEILSDTMRETISRAFNCRVFDFYGAAERVCYIQTCKQGTYHIIPEYGYTELIPEQGSDGRKCRIIATGFWNYAMPFIRYDTGDSVITSDEVCECGRWFPIVKTIVGRDTDVIKTPSGNEYGSTIVARIVKEVNNIMETQVIQDRLDHIIVRYVPAGRFSEKDLAGFRQRLYHFLPSELKIDFESVPAIPRTNNGKLRLIIPQIESNTSA